MPSETTGLQAYTIECTLRGQSIVMNYNSRNLHMLLGSKAVVFYALFSEIRWNSSSKRLQPYLIWGLSGGNEMKKTLNIKPNYAEELLKIIQSPLKNEVLLDRLNDYHERDTNINFLSYLLL